MPKRARRGRRAEPAPVPAGRAGARRDQGFDASDLRTAIVAVIALKILALVLVVDPTSLQAFDLPKSLASRALAWVIAGLLAVALLRYGTSVLPRTRLHALPIIAVASVAVSSIFAEDRYLALFGAYNRYLGLTFALDMLMLYGAAAIAVRTRRDLGVLAGALAIGFIVAAAYAGVQRLGLDPVIWSGDPAARPSSTFGNPDMYGELLIVAFAIFGAGALLGQGWPRGARVGAAALAGVAILTASIVATRATLLGFAAAAVAWGLCYARVRGLRGLASPRFLLAAGLAVVVAAGVVVATPLGARAVATLQGTGVQDRILIWSASLRAARDRPILGWGPDNLLAAFPRYRPPEAAPILAPGENESSAHSWPLQLAATLGLVGLLAFVTLIVSFTVATWRSLFERDATLASAVLSGSAAYWAQGLVSVGAIGIDWWPWLGFGLVAGHLGARAAPSRAKRVAPLLLAAIGLGAAALAATTTVSWGASRAALQAKLAIAVGNAPEAVRAARAAVSADPGRADHWNLLGQALSLGQAWPESGDAAAQAAARAPYEAAYWTNLAQVRAREALAGDTSRGGADAALAAGRRAVAADPNNQVAQSTLAQVALALGRYPEAWGALLQLNRLTPSDPSVGAKATEAQSRDPDAERARQGLERMIAVHDSSTLRIALARAELRLLDKTAARASLMRALQLEPGNAEATQLLALIGG